MPAGRVSRRAGGRASRLAGSARLGIAALEGRADGRGLDLEELLRHVEADDAHATTAAARAVRARGADDGAAEQRSAAAARTRASAAIGLGAVEATILADAGGVAVVAAATAAAVRGEDDELDHPRGRLEQDDAAADAAAAARAGIVERVANGPGVPMI